MVEHCVYLLYYLQYLVHTHILQRFVERATTGNWYRSVSARQGAARAPYVTNELVARVSGNFFITTVTVL